MYAFISGVIDYKTKDAVVINNNGVGFEIFVSNNTLSNLPAVGAQAKIYTYLNVREDALTLFGFANMQEKELFLDLITVSGVGSKTALAILSGISVQNLITAIVSGDVKTISTAKGIGKKTAERIILELKSKLGDASAFDLFSGPQSAPTVGPTMEAVEALVSMGVQRIEAIEIVNRVYEDGNTAEDIIAKALRNMRKIV